MNRSLMAGVLGAVALCCQMTAASVPDFSGSWVSDPRHLEVLHYVDRVTGGWHRHVDGVHQLREYRIDIAQTEDAIAITFPGGDANFLTVPSFPLGHDPHSFITDKGASWMKVTCRSVWDGTTLTVSATRFADRWDVAAPADVTSQETELTSHHVLRLNDPANELTITTTVSDEKGVAEYRQVFRRLPPPKP